MLFISIRILRSFLHEAILNAIKPQISNKNPILDLLLLHSSSLEVIDFFKSNKKFNEVLCENSQIILLIRCYAEYITILCEI